MAAEQGIVKLVKAYEPRLDIRADREFVASMGCANTSTRRYPADTLSNSQIIFSQTTPSVRVGVDRSMELDVTFRVDVGTAGGDPAVSPTLKPLAELRNINFFGPRAFPLHSLCEVLQLRLNDQAFSWEPAEILHALLEYGNDWKDRQYNLGSTPHLPDTSYVYNSGSGTRQVFAPYKDCGPEDSRSIGIWLTDRDPAGKWFEFRAVEQIMISPLAWGDEVQCLFGIQNIDLNLTLRQPLTRVLSGATLVGSTVNNVGPFAVDVTVQRADLHVTYLQPQPNQLVPFRLNYPYHQVRRFVTSNTQGLTNVEPLASFSVNYNNITLHEIPKRMYVFARRELSTVAFNSGTAQGDFDAIKQADYFAAIDTCKVNFDTQDGRLSTLDSYDLWKISTKNGLKRSFQSWQNYIGAVLCLEFGTDMNLNPLLAPSVRGNFQLSLDVDFRDIRDPNRAGTDENEPSLAGPAKYKAYLVIVPIGIMTIENQLITTSIGSITEQDVLAAPWLAAGYRRDHKDFYGSGVSAKNIFQTAAKAWKVAKPCIGPVANLTADILGRSSDSRAQTAAAVARGIGKAAGSGRKSGGAKTRCSSLARRM